MLVAQAPTANPSPNADTQLSSQSAPQGALQGAQHGDSGRRHNMNPNKQAKHLARELNLSKGQVQRIRPILVERKEQMESLRGDASLAPQDRREKMHAIQQDSKAKIEAVLNDTQKQQFEQMLANRRGHNRGQAS